MSFLAYFCENWKIVPFAAHTHTASNTWCRAPGMYIAFESCLIQWYPVNLDHSVAQVGFKPPTFGVHVHCSNILAIEPRLERLENESHLITRAVPNIAFHGENILIAGNSQTPA